MLWVSENKYNWLPLPKWVRFLLDYGYYWPHHDQTQRKIGFISMPCDSVAAGLIALGNMCSSLEEAYANDVDGHFKRIMSTKKNFYKRNECYYNTGKITEEDLFRDGHILRCVWVEHKKKEYRVPIHTQNAHEWSIAGEPPVQTSDKSRLKNINFYNELFESGILLEQNLTISYSGLCLSGRAFGKQETWSEMSNFCFKDSSGIVTSLDTLLTIFDWDRTQISRTLFYNPRTDSFDRPPRGLKLVIADGFDAFSRLFSKEEAKGSDIICVFNRLQERYKLTNISEFIHSLLERFEKKILFSAPPPRGILTLSLERRQKK